MVEFFRAVDLPTNLKGLGFSGDEQQAIHTIAERSIAEAPYLKQFVGEVSVRTLSAALDKASRL
jgi:glycerol dehydrogenase